MKIRPGRTRSLITGVMALVVTFLGAVMLSAAPDGIFGIFRLVWILFGLIAAGAAFYNAFSKEGISLYEIESRQDRSERRDPARPDFEPGDVARFCPNCGKPASERASFCKYCGESL
jgi:hypothetical protein